MKIAFINTYCNGSTGSIVNTLANYCEKKGDKTFKFYGRLKQKNDWKYIGGSRIATFLNNLLVFVFGKVGGFHTRNTKKLIKHLRDLSPDVISIHNIHGNYLNFKLLFKYLSSYNGKIFFTLHDAFLLSGRCCHPNLKCKSFFQCKKCSFLSDYPHVLVDRTKEMLEDKKKYFKNLKNVVFISPSKYIESLIRVSILNEYNHYVINNGIKLPQTPPHIKYKDEKIKLLFVASPWSSSKGSDIVFELVKLLDLSKYELLVVGDIKKTKLAHCSETIKTFGLIGKEDLFDIYRSADLFINPTLQDNFPTVLIEALAFGLPIISFDTGGCREIVGDDCGIILESKTAESLCDVIECFDFNKYNFKKCIEHSKEFSDVKMASSYYDLFSK